MVKRTLPLTWTGSVTVAVAASAGSACGNGSRARDDGWPSRCHSSSAICGASGATISTSGSARARGTRGSRDACAVSSMIRAIAVWKRSAAKSSRTTAMVRCSSRAVAASRVRVGAGADQGLAGGLVDDQAP